MKLFTDKLRLPNFSKRRRRIYKDVLPKSTVELLDKAIAGDSFAQPLGPLAMLGYGKKLRRERKKLGPILSTHQNSEYENGALDKSTSSKSREKLRGE